MSKKSIREILCESCKMNCKLLANNALVFGCFFNHNTNEGLQNAFESCEAQYKAEVEELKRKVESLNQSVVDGFVFGGILEKQKEIEELKKKVEELERDNSELSAGCCIELLCDDGGNPTCKARIENESLKKKLEKADFLARAFAKECPDSEKARAYLKENE